MTPVLTALCWLSAVPAAEPDAIVVIRSGDVTSFHVGGNHFTTYYHGGEVPTEKAGVQKPLAKPFFWPVNAPGQIPTTRAWPMQSGNPGETKDHVHQKSAWFCHGDVQPEWVKLKTKSADRRVGGVDFWSETAGHGRIVCVGVQEPRMLNDRHARLVTLNAWLSPDGLKILDEKRTIDVLSRPEGWYLILDVELTANDGPVTFGDTKEGSMGVRVHDSLRANQKNDSVISASTGDVVKAPAKDNLPFWGRPADWNDYSGTVDGKPVGIAIFDHPDNQPRSNWHTRAYGLLAANPFARAKSGFPAQKGNTKLFRLDKGQSVRLRYAIFTHAGNASTGKVAEAYQTFAAMK